MERAAYILKRLIMAVITVLIILFVLFLLLHFMPGSPFNDEKLSAAQKAILMEKYGLDKPFYIQFINYLKNMLTGDFGLSYNIQANAPVTKIISGRIGVTVRMGLMAALFGSFIGLILGIFAAIKRNSVFDSFSTAVAVIGVSLPNFVFALILQFFFAYKLKLFPVFYSSTEEFKSLILPTLSLCMFTLASVARYSRSEMIEVLESDYILLARAKGISKVRLIVCHGLRNTLIGVITVLAPLVVGLISGSLVIEKAFSIAGMGSLFITAIQQNDYNVVLAVSFIFSVIFIGTMLLVDILYCLIDPRIELVKKGA